MRRLFWPLTILLASFAIPFLAVWFPTASFGSNIFGFVWFFAAPVLLLGLLCVIPVAILRLFNRDKRPRAIPMLATSLLIIPCFLVGYGLGFHWRMQAFHALAERSSNLVAAIKRYEEQNNKPPDNLAELVPEFLSAVPATGMGGCPDYSYYSGKEAEEHFNRMWVLEVSALGPGFKWDSFLYFPDQVYPKTGFGGGLERIGDWAYVHE